MRKPKANTRHAQSRQTNEMNHKAAAQAILNLAAWARMRIGSPKSLVACLMFIVSLSVFVVRFRPAARAATGSGPEHVLSFAYYSIKDDWDSTLTLNNSSVTGLVTTVTVYSLDGRALTLPTLDVKANSNIAISLREFISRTSQTGQFQEGSLNVRFNSDDSMAIAPQLTVSDPAHGISFDMEPPMMPMSSTWEGIWWSLDDKTSGQVMLSNTTDKPLKSVVNVEWRGASLQGSEVSLSGHQTAVLDIKEILSGLGIDAQGLERGGLSITHNGMPGAVIAHGVILKKESRFSSNLPFVDPTMQKNSVLNGTGLMLAHPVSGSAFRETSFFTPQLALRNVSGSSQKASVTVRYTVDGVLNTESLPEISIPPHDVQMADFSSLMSEVRNVHVTAAGLAIESSGAPGTLVAALSSVDDSQNLEVDVPLVSRSVRSGEGGNHPFRLDEEFRSVAYLTNITQKPTKVAVIIFHDGGMYTPELMSVAAGATLAIDLLQLRDSQAKDIQGRTLPVNLAQGQFFWHPHQGEALIGRVVTFDRGVGTAGNFSCQNCCQQELSGLEILPTPITGEVGEFCQLTVNEYESYCGQYTVGPYNYTNSVAYSCDNTSVATVSSTGGVNCIDLGNATITVSFDYYHSELVGVETCGQVVQTATSTSPVIVASVRITQDGANITGTTQDVIVGQRIALTAEVLPSGTSSNHNQWTIPGTRVADYAVSADTGMVTPLTNLSTLSVNFCWVDGADGRQVTFSCKVSGKQFTAQATFNVKRPTVTFTSTSVGGVACDSACGEQSVHYGCTEASPGVTFSLTNLMIPAGFSGDTQLVQLVNTTTRTKLKTSGMRLTKSGSHLLDTTFPYGIFYDTPGEPFDTGDLQITTNDSFTMYVIFKPSFENSIWVPLRKISWSWAGDGNLSGTLNSGSHSPSQGSIDSTDHPQWTANVISLEYH